MTNPLLVNKRVRVAHDVITFARRQLPATGRIIAQVGQEVAPSDILGHAMVSPGFRNVNLADELTVSPSEAITYLRPKIGQKIFKGELLAYKSSGLFQQKKIVTSPTDALLHSYNDKTGELRLSFLPHQVDLPAAVFGVIEKISEQKGEVLIRTQATEIYGLFGTGKSREGQLKILGNRGDLADRSRMSSSLAGLIVVAGALIYSAALADAVAMGIHGIITGGINASDLKSMSGGRLQLKKQYGTDIGIGLMVTEGFGSISIGEDIFETLASFNDRFVILDGNRSRLSLPSGDPNCLIKIKSTQIPDIEKKEVDPIPDIEALPLTVGQKVRSIGKPMGDQGEVVAIDSSPTLLPSGVATYLVTVATHSRKIKVPYSNVELIG